MENVTSFVCFNYIWEDKNKIFSETFMVKKESKTVVGTHISSQVCLALV